MASNYINDMADYVLQYPNFVAKNKKDKSGNYSPIVETFTVPLTPNYNGKYVLILDYLINPVKTFKVTINAVDLVNIDYGLSPDVGQVARQLGDLPLLEFPADYAGESGTVTYTPLQSYVSAGSQIAIEKEIERINYAIDNGEIGSGGGGGSTAWGSITGTLSNQTDLNSALSGKANSVHSHTISDVTNLQNALDDKANSVHSHAISDITNLQTSLNAKANSSHTHTLSQITDAGSAASKNIPNTGVDATTTQVVMGDDTRLTDSRTPTAHTHSISDVTNLQTTLNGKANSVHNHTKADITDFAHTHAISDVTNLQTTLNGKANTSHTHAISDVTNLQTTLNGKASLSSTNTFTGNNDFMGNFYIGDSVSVEINSNISHIGNLYNSGLVRSSNGFIGGSGSTCTYNAVFGDDLGTVGLTPATSAAIQIGKTTGDSGFYFGQSNTGNAHFIWRRNATPANAYAELVTYGYSNNILIDGKELQLQTKTGGGSTGFVKMGNGTATAGLQIQGTLGLQLRSGTSGNYATIRQNTSSSNQIRIEGQPSGISFDVLQTGNKNLSTNRYLFDSGDNGYISIGLQNGQTTLTSTNTDHSITLQAGTDGDYAAKQLEVKYDASTDTNKIGFLGATPIARPNLDMNQSQQTLIENIATILQDYGLVTRLDP